MVVPEKIYVKEMISLIKETAGNLLKDAGACAIFRGHPVPPGEKSISFRLIFQSDERTLTMEEIDEIAKKIISRFKDIGGYLR